MQRRSVKGMPWLSLETVLVAPLNDRREIETKCALHTGPAAVRMASRSGPIAERGAAPSVEAASAKSKTTRTAKGITMEFDLLDGYLLDGKPDKGELVRRLLESPSQVEGASPFYEGMRLLGKRTPELSLIALRLVLAGKRADDAAVTSLRAVVERARNGQTEARREYHAILGAA